MKTLSSRAHFCARIFALVTLTLYVAPAFAAPPQGLDLEFGGSGAQPGKFADLRDMAFDGQDVLLTLEGLRETRDRDTKYPGNGRVQRFDASGKPLSQFSIADPALLIDKTPGHEGEPSHIAGDAAGNIYVSFPGRDLVRKFSSTGQKLADFSIPGATGVARYLANGRERIAVVGGAQQVINGKWASVGGESITLIEGDKTETVPLGATLTQVADLAADKAGNFYVLAEGNALSKFAPDGKLLKTLGARTNTQAEDGSELKHSVSVDSKGNVLSLANSFLTRFDSGFQTVTQREVRYNWFEPSGWRIVALDNKDRIWAATPDLTTHSLFERFHFRPAVVRAETSYFDPQEKGVRVASALGIGLKPSIAPAPQFGVAYDLKPFSSDLVVAPANRNVGKVQVEYRVFDAFRQQAGGGKFEMALEDGKEARAPMTFTPPRFGWYTLDVSIGAGAQSLFRIGQHVGITPNFAGMIKLEHAPGMDATNDAPKQMFVGLPNMRLNAGTDPGSLDHLEKTLATALKYGAVPFVAFTDEKDVTEASVRAAVTRFKGRVKVWEIINEPNLRMAPEKYVNDYLKLASRIIREVDPAAKVMGPTGCGISIPWYDGFYKAGGGPMTDIISVHDYEGHETVDPIHWRWKFAELRRLMAANGDANKPLWQTERVFSAVRGGNFMGLYQATNMAQHRDLLETLDVSPDHNNHYYVSEMGYGDVPSYIWSRQGPFPAAFVTRTRYAQTLGRAYAGTLDFGPMGNRMFSALRYKGAHGQTIILRNEGTSDRKLALEVKGGKTLEVVDAWGNSSSLPLRGGKAELTVTQLPTYLRLAANQDVVAPRFDFGRDLAERATFAYSAPAKGSMSLLNNGVVEVIHAGNPDGGTDGGKIWTGDLPEIGGKIAPQTLDISFDRPRTFDKIVLHGLRADNQFSTLLDYDLQAQVGGAWKTLAEVRTPIPASDPVVSGATIVTTWQGNEHLLIHRLAAPVTSAQLRLVARRSTYGFQFDKVASDATQTTWGGRGNPKLMLREVEVFAPQSGLEVAAQVAQPLKTSTFAPENASVTLRNTGKAVFKGMAKLSPPAGWSVEPRQLPVALAPGKTQTVSLRVTPPAQLPIGPAFIDVEVSGAKSQSVENGWLRYDIASPLEFSPGGARDVGAPAQRLVASVKNTTDKPLSGSAQLRVGELNLAQPFGPIEPGKTAEVAWPVPDLKLAGERLNASYEVTANNLRVSATQQLGVREWNVIGTWPNALDTVFGPEAQVGRVDLAKNFSDGMGQEQKWRVMASEPNGYLNLLSLQPHENVTAYALITVSSPTARKAIFSAGTDDGGKAWLNGKEVFTDTAAHDAAPGQVQKPVELKAGRNEVLFKIVQGKFNMGLFFDLLDENGKPMNDLTFSSRP